MINIAELIISHHKQNRPSVDQHQSGRPLNDTKVPNQAYCIIQSSQTQAEHTNVLL